MSYWKKFLNFGFVLKFKKIIFKLNKIKENVNVICIDWKEGAASPNYFSAVKNVRIAGEKTASFIVSNLINPKKVHCIGHSLGKFSTLTYRKR